jgi:hypothetical protein
VYEQTFLKKDLQAVERAQEFIDAFNDLQLIVTRQGRELMTISLNRPAVWVHQAGTR